MSDRNIPTIDKKDLDNVRQLIENEIKQNKLAPLELTDIISDNNAIDDIYVDKAEDNLNHFIKTTIKNVISNEIEQWLQLKLTDIGQIKKKFQYSNLNQRKKIKGLDSKRAEIILAGTIICEQIMIKYNLEKIKVSDRGLRWGLLYEELG